VEITSTLKERVFMNYLSTFSKVIPLVALVYLRMFEPALWGQITSTHSTLELILNYFVFVLALQLAISLLSFYYRKRKKYSAAKKDNVINGLQNLYYLILTGATIMTILGFWNIDARTLFTTLSIVAAAIAIISKDYLVDIISGMIISFSNEISIDDYVKIGEHKGKIIDINLTKIALINEDDDIVFLPNNKVFSGEIVNFTKGHIRKVNIEFELDLRFLKTIEELEDDLINCLSDYHAQMEEDKFLLRIVNINKESLSLKFQFQLLQVNREIERELRKMTVRRVVNYIKRTQEEGLPALLTPIPPEES